MDNTQNQIIHDFLLTNEFFDMINTIVENANEISNSRREEEKKRKREDAINTLKSQLEKLSPPFRDIIINRIKLQIETENEDLFTIVKEILDETFWSFKVKETTDSNLVEDFYPKSEEIKTFPENTWLLYIKFKLRKPYTSKDESEFHYSNNPILRDRLLGCPMVAPSTWKGNLRSAARRLKGDNENKINRLFGPESDDDGNARKGRLYFFPTFFTGESKKDVITPLSRETRTPVRGPIDMEVVPAGETGDFYLLYFPYPMDKDWKPEEVQEDLKFTAEALEKMFLEYGFSAKKTSGFGVIHERFETCSLWWSRETEKRPLNNVRNFHTLKSEIEKMRGGVK